MAKIVNLRPKWGVNPHICNLAIILCKKHPFWGGCGWYICENGCFCAKNGKNRVKPPYSPPYMQKQAKNGPKTYKKRPKTAKNGQKSPNFQNILQKVRNICSKFDKFVKHFAITPQNITILCDLLHKYVCYDTKCVWFAAKMTDLLVLMIELAEV